MINGKLSEALEALYSDTLLSVEVPEWADMLEDGRVYYKPVTIADLQPLGNKPKGEGDVELVVTKAMNASGEYLFERGKATRDLIRSKVPAHIVQNIADAMCKVPQPEEIKKN